MRPRHQSRSIDDTKINKSGRARCEKQFREIATIGEVPQDATGGSIM
jgi:hypothetical protein